MNRSSPPRVDAWAPLCSDKAARKSAAGQPSRRSARAAASCRGSRRPARRRRVSASRPLSVSSSAPISSRRPFARNLATGSGGGRRAAKPTLMPCAVSASSRSKAASAPGERRTCTSSTSTRTPGSPSIAASRDSRSSASSSSGSRSIHRTGRRSRSAHWASSVVLPNPAGATIVTMVPSPVPQSRLRRAVRTTAFPVTDCTPGILDGAASARVSGSKTDTGPACSRGCARPRVVAGRGKVGAPPPREGRDAPFPGASHA